VLAQYERGEAAITNRDMHEFRATMTPESWAWSAELLRLAREASEKETKNLEPTKMMEVVVIRNRMEPSKLRTMMPEDYLMWKIENGVLKTDAENGVAVHSVKIRNDQAEIQMGEVVEKEGKRTRVGRGLVRSATGAISNALSAETTVEPIEHFVLHFTNINGYWYYCSQKTSASLDRYFQSFTTETKMPMWEIIASFEELEHGSIKSDVWSPPKM
jgi:hypothetical protein